LVLKRNVELVFLWIQFYCITKDVGLPFRKTKRECGAKEAFARCAVPVAVLIGYKLKKPGTC
jgi:hypothetical protein